MTRTLYEFSHFTKFTALTEYAYMGFVGSNLLFTTRRHAYWTNACY